jgi:hypothetical protein
MRGGRIVFVVPCESIRESYRLGDVNHHLYSWSPMCVGNLVSEAGFVIEECKSYIHLWPPRIYRLVAKVGGRKCFDLACRLYGFLTYLNLTRSKTVQVRVVARRPFEHCSEGSDEG